MMWNWIVSLWTSLFGSKQTTLEAPQALAVPEEKHAVPGQRYVLKTPYRGPWPSEYNTPCIVLVRDVRDGWVRYAVEGASIMLQDERCEEKHFVKIFEPTGTVMPGFSKESA